MLMNFALCGWPRPAWPCKPKLSDPMAKGKTLCPLKILGVFAPWYFDGWCDSWSPTQQYCWGWGVGDTASLFAKQHLWAPHREVVWIRGTPVNSDRVTLEAKHEHQHDLTPSWIIYFCVENQKMSKKWAFFCPTCATCNFSSSFQIKWPFQVNVTGAPESLFFFPRVGDFVPLSTFLNIAGSP